MLLTIGIGALRYIYEVPPLIYLLRLGAGGCPERSEGDPSLSTRSIRNQTSSIPIPRNKPIRGRGGDPGLLYSVGVLDLGKGPLILKCHRPLAIRLRYRARRLAGRRLRLCRVARTSGQASDFLISPRTGWQGTVPAGVTQIKSPDNSVILIGRVLCRSQRGLGGVQPFGFRCTHAPERLAASG